MEDSDEEDEDDDEEDDEDEEVSNCLGLCQDASCTRQL